MPVQDGPVGPFPPDVDAEEYDKRRRRILWKMPSGLYVLGSRSGDERNAMTLSWATQISFDPKLVAVSVERGALTHRLIEAGGSFSVNLIAREDRANIRKFTKPVEVDLAARTLNGFAFHDGRTGVPILDGAAAAIECEVRSAVPAGGHTLFVGEVVDAVFQRDEETEILRMEDTRMSYGG
jgi:flavin reductase (DIM6/NTAB) family NADH-FMN oxidoreductase RutF